MAETLETMSMEKSDEPDRPKKVEGSGRHSRIQAAFVVAVFASGLFGGYQLAPEPEGASPVVYEAGRLVATGELENALYDPSLRAEEDRPVAGGAFVNGEGQTCRRFKDGKVEGLACQRGGDWSVAELRQH